MKQVVRALAFTLAAAAGLVAALPAQAALVKFRIQGIVTQSWPFEDGSTVSEGAPVTVTYTYESQHPADVMDRRENGAGTAVFSLGAPFHFRLWVGDHRVRAATFRVAMSNDLVDSPFGDIYEVQTEGGAWVDGAWRPQARLGLMLSTQYGHFDALRGLRLPRYLREHAFDAFRVGTLWRTPDQPQLQFAVLSVRSSVCGEARPGTDECADN